MTVSMLESGQDMVYSFYTNNSNRAQRFNELLSDFHCIFSKTLHF